MADIAVQFEPIAHPSARDLELVFLRINRLVGDGYQPVYGSLVTCADIPTPTTLAPGHANGGVGVGAVTVAETATERRRNVWVGAANECIPLVQ